MNANNFQPKTLVTKKLSAKKSKSWKSWSQLRRISKVKIRRMILHRMKRTMHLPRRLQWPHRFRLDFYHWLRRIKNLRPLIMVRRTIQRCKALWKCSKTSKVPKPIVMERNLPLNLLPKKPPVYSWRKSRTLFRYLWLKLKTQRMRNQVNSKKIFKSKSLTISLKLASKVTWG